MRFWTKVSDWIYDITEPITAIFKPLETIFKKTADFISAIAELIMNFIGVALMILLGLLIAAGILFAIYWIGKALLGFIKYYSQFAWVKTNDFNGTPERTQTFRQVKPFDNGMVTNRLEGGV